MRSSMMARTSVTAKLVLMLASIVFSVLLGEVGVRIYQRFALGIPLSVNAAVRLYLDGQAPVPFCCVPDPRLGWRPRPNLRFDGEGQRADGTRYALHVTQDRAGFRARGRLTPAGPKILFLGDSFTQALEVSDDQTYYAEIGQDLGAEVFAVGARGYASLQEFLLMDEVLDRVRPDVIVWQFCQNDFMANSYDLERAWTPSALGLPRPFLNGGRIELRIPQPYAWLLELPGGSARLIALGTTRYKYVRYLLDGKKDVLLEDIEARGLQHPDFRVAVGKTREILALVVRRAGGTPIVLWEACTTVAPFHPAVRDLARQLGMHFVDELPGAVEHSVERELVLRTTDRIHWSPEGHRVVARTLGPYLRRSGLLGSHLRPSS